MIRGAVMIVAMKMISLGFDMDMADVEIGAGCCQQAAKGGVCIANTVLGVTL
mgnify:CR=1 FL=1